MNEGLARERCLEVVAPHSGFVHLFGAYQCHGRTRSGRHCKEAAVNLAEIPLFDLAERRLAWIDSRERVLARNIANADTPGWKPQDIRAFSADLRRAQSSLVRTDPHHLMSNGAERPLAPKTRGERAPDGNAVSLDDQLARLADSETAHELASDLYKKYLGFFRLAIGR